MASLDGSPVAPFIPGGAEETRISLENPTTTLFVSQVEVCCCVEIEAGGSLATAMRALRFVGRTG